VQLAALAAILKESGKQLAALAAILKESGNRPLEVGFVVGFGGRSLRGKLNALLAPASSRSIILCYVLP